MLDCERPILNIGLFYRRNKVAQDKSVAKAKAPKKATKGRRSVKLPKFLSRIGGYFVGSWQELKQVRWPSRKATWSLTLAVIAFSAFWALVILGLDLVSENLMERLILNN